MNLKIIRPCALTSSAINSEFIFKVYQQSLLRYLGRNAFNLYFNGMEKEGTKIPICHDGRIERLAKLFLGAHWIEYKTRMNQDCCIQWK